MPCRSGNTYKVEPHEKREDTREFKPCPEDSANFISRLLYAWITRLIYRGYRKPLKFENLYDVREIDRCEKVVGRLETQWEHQIRKTGYQMVRPAGPGGRPPQLATGSPGHDEPEPSPPEVNINTKTGGTSPSVWMALLRAFGPYYFAAGFLKLIADLLPFINPQILGLLLNHMADLEDPLWRGYLMAGALCGVTIVRTLLNQTSLHMCFRTGMHARSAILGVIFRKALRLSSGARRETTVGEVVNLMAVDAQRCQEAPAFQHAIWVSPIQLAVALYFIWRELGPSSLAGFATMMLLFPINAVISTKLRKLQFMQMRKKDARIKMTNEMLNGIKVLKMYAWEAPFTEQLLGIRRAELKLLKGIAYWGAVTAFSFTLAPYLISLSSFACYVLVSEENILTARKAFVSLALFELMNFPLSTLPNTITGFVQIRVSMSRIKGFLKSEELDPDNAGCRENEDAAIRITNGTFAWAAEDSPVLRDMSVRVPAGRLVAVVGQVGAGKSSLLSAMLGEMHVQKGDVHIKGKVSYVPQQAWIRNASLRSNVLFGSEFQRDLYTTTIETCALEPDLKILPAGDLTEIGEKGINLSGGQKQRVSLARALYQNHDIYLLDDPLSAVDAHVGKHIFDKVIGPEGVLRSKTRILVTNSLWVLPYVDEIIVLSDGRLSEQGPYKDLLQDDGDFAEFCATYLSEQGEEEDETQEVLEMRRVLVRRVSSIAVSKSAAIERTRRSIRQKRRTMENDLRSSQRYIRASQRKPGGLTGEEDFCRLADKEKYMSAIKVEQGRNLIQAEQEQTGSIGVAVWRTYMRACGACPSFWVIASTLLLMVARVATNIWLSEWSEDFSANLTLSTQSELDDLRDVRLGVFGALGCSQALFTVIQAILIAVSCLNASEKLHGDLLKATLRAPMSFFDTTPLGRILNRFSKDMDIIDLQMPRSIRFFLVTFSTVVTTLVIISYSSPPFLAAILPIALLYFFVQRVYVASSRQLKRIDATRRSPIFTNFGESVNGSDSVRAYGKQDQFIQHCDDLVDKNNMAYYGSIVLNRWLGVYLELIGSLILLASALSVVAQRGSISTSNAGLSIAFALQITVVLGVMVRAMCDLENNVVAAERVQEYVDIEQEAPDVIEDSRISGEWPPRGQVEIKDYSLRYRPGFDLILKGVNFVIQPGEKVGIVGRTGAGKSSLTLGLFRIIEAAGGSILIDGQDIANLGLHDLRSRITIIPQDPVVFSGSLRINLDPHHTQTDEEIWAVLEQASMKDFVKDLPGQLEFKCSEGGDNVSMGQRQLICLARALLRKTRILVLDEATAAMDVATDDFIQNTIRTQFRDCTVLTIAHRLNTILDYDRIMVLDKGQVAEMGSVDFLVNKKDGILRGMMLDAGLVKADAKDTDKEGDGTAETPNENNAKHDRETGEPESKDTDKESDGPVETPNENIAGRDKETRESESSNQHDKGAAEDNVESSH